MCFTKIIKDSSSAGIAIVCGVCGVCSANKICIIYWMYLQGFLRFFGRVIHYHLAQIIISVSLNERKRERASVRVPAFVLTVNTNNNINNNDRRNISRNETRLKIYFKKNFSKNKVVMMMMTRNKIQKNYSCSVLLLIANGCNAVCLFKDSLKVGKLFRILFRWRYIQRLLVVALVLLFGQVRRLRPLLEDGHPVDATEPLVLLDVRDAVLQVADALRQIDLKQILE